jgi:dTMP kinase
MFFNENMKKGTFITFEGIDGSGKSTLSRLVFDQLLSLNLTGVHTFEPTDSSLGNSLRDIILYSKENLSPLQQALLFTADRISHFDWIHKNLLDKQFVICDRFIHSTLAYQGVDEKTCQSINTIHDLCLVDFKPDIVFLLDIDPLFSLTRMQENKLDKLQKKEKDNFEKVEFLKEVRSRYLSIAHSNTDSFVILDGSKPLDLLTKQVIERVRGRFVYAQRG